jgi:hypothetical protein
VECDGDHYHGPDKWMDDIHRQRLLERAGWKFWRCWGSSFARDRMGCIEDLVNTLAEEGIEPLGEEPLDFSGIVEFREITALEGETPIEETVDEFIEEISEVETPAEEEATVDSNSMDTSTIPLVSIAIPPSPAVSDIAELQPLKPGGNETTNHRERELSAEITVGDAVSYQITDRRGTREEYIMLLNQPSNWKLGIVSIDERIAKCLLGRKQGDIFEADLGSDRAKIEILMKHEVDAQNDRF